jgi:hypothetical protein
MSYEYKQHPHVANRKDPSEKAELLILNKRIGLWVTRQAGTISAAYIFFGLALISLPATITSGNVIVIVSWIAQTFLQLVLVPIIFVGQNILAESKEIQAHLVEQDKMITKLSAKLNK